MRDKCLRRILLLLLTAAVLVMIIYGMYSNHPLYQFNPQVYQKKYNYKKHTTKNRLHGERFYRVSLPTTRTVAWEPVRFSIHPLHRGDLAAGQTTFRSEATHENELLIVDILHNGNDTYTGTFLPTFQGSYTITVNVLYVNNQHLNYTSHIKAKMVSIRGSPFRVIVTRGMTPTNITRYCTQVESGIAKGRWVRCDVLANIEKCNRWQKNKLYSFDGNKGFFWLPYTCQLHRYTKSEIHACFARNGWESIVFTGDSHSRFRTYHWATRLYGKCENCQKNHIIQRFDESPKMEWIMDARGTRWPASFKTVNTPREIYIQQNRRSLFSDPLPEMAFNGSLYIINFGHWLLRELTLEDFMRDKLKANIEAIKLHLETDINGRPDKRPKRVLWVNTMSLIWRNDIYAQNWKSTLSPDIGKYWNLISDTAMTKAGIQIVDAFQVSNGRLYATFDKTHYAKVFNNSICGGAVENEISNVIFNALCSTWYN